MTGEDDGLAAVASQYPAWHAWRGVNGRYYARRLKSSPPIVVNAADPAALAGAIESAENALDDGRRP